MRWKPSIGGSTSAVRGPRPHGWVDGAGVSLSAVDDDLLDIQPAAPETVPVPAPVAVPAAEPPAGTPLDLDAIETDLADVEIALARLESGEYWTCEVTGQPLSDELLAAKPTARRLAAS